MSVEAPFVLSTCKMMRSNVEGRLRRERGENWNDDERKLLQDLINDHIDIIENKNTDTTTNMQKLEAWKSIWEKFVMLNPKPRTVQKLREQWKRMKIRSKKMKKKNLLDKNTHDSSDQNEEQNQTCPIENGTVPAIPQADYRFARDSIMNIHKDSNAPTKLFRSKNGIYKKSMLGINKLVKQQIMDCAIAEHELKMEQMKEEHFYKMERAKEIHLLQCEHERLKIELVRLDIEIKKKQLNDYVI